MRDDLRKVELRSKLLLQEEAYLFFGVTVRVRPPPKVERRNTLANLLSQHVRIFDTAWRTNRAIPSQHCECLVSVGCCPCGVHQTVLESVLARENRDELCRTHVTREVRR